MILQLVGLTKITWSIHQKKNLTTRAEQLYEQVYLFIMELFFSVVISVSPFMVLLLFSCKLNHACIFSQVDIRQHPSSQDCCLPIWHSSFDLWLYFFSDFESWWVIGRSCLYASYPVSLSTSPNMKAISSKFLKLFLKHFILSFPIHNILSIYDYCKDKVYNSIQSSIDIRNNHITLFMSTWYILLVHLSLL